MNIANHLTKYEIHEIYGTSERKYSHTARAMSRCHADHVLSKNGSINKIKRRRVILFLLLRDPKLRKRGRDKDKEDQR